MSDYISDCPNNWRELHTLISAPPIVAINLKELHALYHPDTDFITEVGEQCSLTVVSYLPGAPWEEALADPRFSLDAVYADPRNHFFMLHKTTPKSPYLLSYCPVWATMHQLFIGQGWPWPEGFNYGT